MRNVFILKTYLVFLGLLLSSFAYSDVRVGTTNVMPWGIEHSSGENSGLLVDFLNVYRAHVKEPIKNRLKPYPRVINDIDLGHSDMAVMFKSPQSDAMAYSLGEVVEVDIIAVSKTVHQKVRTIDQLVGKRIAYVRGSKYGPQFDNHATLHKVPVNNMNQGLKMLMKNHVDVVVSTDQAIYYGIDSLGLNPKMLTKILVISTARADLYLSKKSPLVSRRKEFEIALKEVKDSGKLMRIFYDRNFISSDLLNQDNHPVQGKPTIGNTNLKLLALH